MKRHGINPLYFAEKVTASGLVLNDRVQWICYHGAYDFADFLKLMMNETLPQYRDQFFNYLKLFFPNIYDIKSFFHEFSDHLDNVGGLNRIADILGIERIGMKHQAGSDSLVTSAVFFKLKLDYKQIFEPMIDHYKNDIFGFLNDQAYPVMKPLFQHDIIIPDSEIE